MEIERDVLEAFAFYVAVLLGKMFLVQLVASITRLVKDSFANAEDAACSPRGRVNDGDPDVARLERLVASDLQDVAPFVALGALYLGVAAPELYAVNKGCQVFVTARIVHTMAYLFKIPQPCRLLAYLTSLSVNLFMTYKIIMATL